MARILIIEDETAIAELEKDYLELSDFEVVLESDGSGGAARALDEDFDLIILDLMLPGMNGFDICKLIRETKNTPIIMVSAKSEDIDKIRGLGLGADDYMTKPFAPAELLAHLRALTRRQGEVLFEKLAAGDLVLNLESYDLACGSKSIHLSYKEFSLAKVLMANAGQVVSKDMLIAKVWGVESSAEDNNVEAYVSFLRKKMKFLGSTARIETLRRAGYRFVADAAPDDASESAGLPC